MRNKCSLVMMDVLNIIWSSKVVLLLHSENKMDDCLETMKENIYDP